MFQPSLDSSFLSNLIPLKTPPTMMTCNSINVSNGGSNNCSINNSSIVSNTTPINVITNFFKNKSKILNINKCKLFVSLLKTKLRTNANLTINQVNRRAIYEPAYKSGVMNSSKNCKTILNQYY